MRCSTRPAVASAARKAAAKALTLTYENSYHAERELRQALADLLAEQGGAGAMLPATVRAARDKARAVIDREGGPMTPWGLDMCAVLDALDDWERSRPAPPPASDEVREAAEMLRLTLGMRDVKHACYDRACSNVALAALNLLAALRSDGR